MGTNSKKPSSVIKRFFVMVLIIKNSKNRISVLDINRQLKTKGINISLRTTQRDLQSMQELGIPVYSDDCNPQGWRVDTKNPLAEVVELLEAA